MSGPIPSADGLLNQWAADATGRVIPAGECALDVEYLCPLAKCGGALRVRAVESEFYRPHLYHVRSECAVPGGGGESDLHSLAKRVMAQRLGDWLSGRATMPFLARRCDACGEPIAQPGWIFGATAVDVEARIGTRVADVLVTRPFKDVLIAKPGRPLAIEILVTHAVDEEKASDLEAEGADWIEIAADEVLGEKPWVFTRGDGSQSCPVCVQRARAAAATRAAESASLESERRIEAARRRAEDAERASTERVKLVTSSYDQLTSEVERLQRRSAGLDAEVDRNTKAVRAQEEQRDAIARTVAALADPSTLATYAKLRSDALVAEFVRRGARMLPSGCIVTAAGENTEDFRRRAYSWIAAVLGIAIAQREVANG